MMKINKKKEKLLKTTFILNHFLTNFQWSHTHRNRQQCNAWPNRSATTFATNIPFVLQHTLEDSQFGEIIIKL